MSKKMMKRSLALGALMAFVITGSAMAAEYKLVGDVETSGAQYFTNHTNGVNVSVLGNGSESIRFVGNNETASSQGVNVAIGGWRNESSINNVKDIVVDKTWLNVFNTNGTNNKVEASLTINANGDISTTKDANISYFAHSMGGTLNITANSMTLYDGDILAQSSGGFDSITNIAITNDFVTNGNVYAFNMQTGNGDAISEVSIEANNITIDNTYGVEAYTYVNEANKGVNVKLDADEKLIVKSNSYVAISAYDSFENVNNNKSVVVEAKYIELNGVEGSIYADNKAAVTVGANKDFVYSKIDGDVWALNNSEVTINIGKKGYLNGNVYNDSTSFTSINFGDSSVWNLTDASTLTKATFNVGSVLVIDGETFAYNKEGENVYALNGSGSADVLKVVEGANIKVEGIDYKKYNVATGFENVEATENYWDVSNLNNLMQGEWIGNAKDGLQLSVTAKKTEDIATDLGVGSGTADALGAIIAGANSSEAPKTEAAQNVIEFANAIASATTPEAKAVAADAAEAVAKMAEAGGQSATAAKVVTNVTGVTNQRMSFSGAPGSQKGGHGVGLLEEGSGAAIWAQYVHGKDTVEDMPSTAGASSYTGQHNGIVMGVDFKKVGKFQSGVAFNYGEGDTNSMGSSAVTKSEYDFWGVGYYGNIRNEDTNVIFDVNYAKTDSDVTNKTFAGDYEASPETTTWTAGVKVEKLYQNNNVQIIPYTGLRYMSIDSDDYTTKCGTFSYKMDRQDIWLLPLGVSIRQEVVNDNGWVVTPKVDLSYIWAFGDTDSTMEFATALNTKTPIGYDVMDEGSWLGLVGIEAAMDDWTFGVSYSYQKGDHSESKKWYVDAKYSF